MWKKIVVVFAGGATKRAKSTGENPGYYFGGGGSRKGLIFQAGMMISPFEAKKIIPRIDLGNSPNWGVYFSSVLWYNLYRSNNKTGEKDDQLPKR